MQAGKRGLYVIIACFGVNALLAYNHVVIAVYIKYSPNGVVAEEIRAETDKGMQALLLN